MSLKNVGALWRKRKTNGEEFLAGKVTATGGLLIFKNKRKHGPRDPDYIVTQADDQAGNDSILPNNSGWEGR
jgi:uncharacterized protein (DUF736 family)